MGIQKKRLNETVLLSTQNNIEIDGYENINFTLQSFVNLQLIDNGVT